MSGAKVGDKGVVNFRACKSLLELRLTGTRVTDAGLAHFKNCKHLKQLDIHGLGISDDGLVHFQGCKDLEQLRLQANLVTDKGLRYFKDCKNLTVLDVHATKVTNTGLAHVKDCNNLTYLGLANTEVSDKGLTYFKDCKNLKNITLYNTKVSATSVKEFHKAIPGCRIDWNGGIIQAKAAPPDPDRRAAEYVLANDGYILISGSKRVLRTVAHLPKRPFQLTLVYMRYTKKVTDVGLACLEGCKHLTHLELGNTPVSDLGMTYFKNCTTLKHLGLSHTKVTDNGVANFKNCKNLQELQLTRTGVTNAGLAHFKACRQLTYLDLQGTNISDDGLVHFRDCKNLDLLRLQETRVTDKGLRYFKDCKNLTFLDVHMTKVTNTGLAYFKDCHNLKYLGLDNTKVSDKELTHFKNHQKLTTLTLYNTNVSAMTVKELHEAIPNCRIFWNGGLIPRKNDPISLDFRAYAWFFAKGGQLTGMTKSNRYVYIKKIEEFPDDYRGLVSINLNDTKIVDAELAKLKDLTNWHVRSKNNNWGHINLNLHNTAISDAGLKHLYTLSLLHEIHLFDTKVTATGVRQLRQKLPQCNISSKHGSMRAQPTWELFAARKVLNVNGKVTIRVNNTLKQVSQTGVLPNEPFQLVEVDLTKNKQLLRMSFEALNNSKHIEAIWLDDAHFNEKRIEGVSSLHGLKKLGLRNTKISNKTIGLLGKMTGLEYLNLQKTRVTDAGLQELSRHKSLQYLNVRNTQVTATGVAKLQKALPTCKIEWDGKVEAKPPVKNPASTVSPLDRLDSRNIDPATRPIWQPRELVAVFGKSMRINNVDMAISPNGKLLAFFTGLAKDVILWDLEKNKERWRKTHKAYFRKVVFTADSRKVITVSSHHVVNMWDAINGKCIHTFSGPTKYSTDATAVTQDGKKILLPSSAKSCIYDVGKGQQLMQLKGVRYLRCATFAPNGHSILTASSSLDDYKLSLCDAKTGVVRTTFRGHTSHINAVVFSPDGKRVASASQDDTARIWDTETGKELHRCVGHVCRGRAEGVSAVAFSPDGTTLATGANSYDRILLWDVRTGKQQREIVLKTAMLRLHFAPDGRHLITANNDGTIYVLRLNVNKKTK